MRTLYFCRVSILCFSRLISAVADWMSTILLHMVWPVCKFRMQVWNVLHAACWKCRTRKIAKNSPSGHYRTTLSGYIVATKACIDNRKKLVIEQCLPHMCSQYGELLPTSDWDLLARVAGVSQSLRHWTEGATCIRQGGHHVGHWPTL